MVLVHVFQTREGQELRCAPRTAATTDVLTAAYNIPLAEARMHATTAPSHTATIINMM